MYTPLSCVALATFLSLSFPQIVSEAFHLVLTNYNYSLYPTSLTFATNSHS